MPLPAAPNLQSTFKASMSQQSPEASSALPGLLPGSQRARDEHFEWEDAADCYLSLPALSSPAQQNHPSAL